MSFENKKIKQWSSKDVITWIKSIGLSQKWMTVMIEAITETECVGQDFMTIKSPNDISDSFDIKIPILCNRVFKEIQKRKKYELDKVISAAAKQFANIDLNDEEDSKSNDKGFQIQLFAQNKWWTPFQKVCVNTTVRRIKELYKMESGVGTNVDGIKVAYKGKYLQDHQTLGNYGIVDENHMLIVFHDVRAN
eukprot:467474_1